MKHQTPRLVLLHQFYRSLAFVFHGEMTGCLFNALACECEYEMAVPDVLYL
jgi:hypothetical protein